MVLLHLYFPFSFFHASFLSSTSSSLFNPYQPLGYRLVTKLKFNFVVRASFFISTIGITVCLFLQEYTSCTLVQFGGIGLLSAAQGNDSISFVYYCDCYRGLYSAFLIAISFNSCPFVLSKSRMCVKFFSLVIQICLVLNCKYFSWECGMAFISVHITFSFTLIACFPCALSIPKTNQLIFQSGVRVKQKVCSINL